MQATDEIARFLRSKGLRYTKTKEKIIESILGKQKPLTSKQLIEEIDSSHFVSVYRSIDSMLSAGVLKIASYTPKPSFELSEKFAPHHHHITCANCKKIKVVDDRKIEELIEQSAKSAGFKLHSHHLELSGLCSSCAKDKPS